MSEDWLQALIAGSGSTPDWTNAEERAQGILHAVLLDLLDYRSALTTPAPETGE